MEEDYEEVQEGGHAAEKGTMPERVRAGLDDLRETWANEPQTGARNEHREGAVARSIEQQTAKLPSDIFLWAALGSITASLIFQFTGDHRKANFVGHWAPTFFTLGIYNKLVKLHGSDGA